MSVDGKKAQARRASRVSVRSSADCQTNRLLRNRREVRRVAMRSKRRHAFVEDGGGRQGGRVYGAGRRCNEPRWWRVREWYRQRVGRAARVMAGEAGWNGRCNAQCVALQPRVAQAALNRRQRLSVRSTTCGICHAGGEGNGV